MRKYYLLTVVIWLMLATFLVQSVYADDSMANILQILYTTIFVSAEEALDRNEAIARMRVQANLIVYKADETYDDGMKYPVDVLRDRNGDCEDFTMFVLVQLKKFGFHLNDLGFALIRFKELPLAHLVPMYFDGGQWRIIDHWIKISIDDNAHINWTIDAYIWWLDIAPDLEIEAIIFVRGMTKSSIVEFLSDNSTQMQSFDEFRLEVWNERIRSIVVAIKTFLENAIKGW